MNGNEIFQYHKYGIAKLCRVCSLFDLLDHRHGDKMETKSHIWGTMQKYFILYPFNILQIIKYYGMIGLKCFTSTDHRRLFINIASGIILIQKNRHPFTIHKKITIQNSSTNILLKQRFTIKPTLSWKFRKKRDQLQWTNRSKYH